MQDQENVEDREGQSELQKAQTETSAHDVSPRHVLRGCENGKEDEKGLQDHRFPSGSYASALSPFHMIENARLYLLLTRRLCRGAPLATLEAALRGGVDLVQIREKPFVAADRAYVDEIVACCREHDVGCIVNDSLDLATRADGLHLGQGDLEPHAPGHFVERTGLLGISTHDPAELARALLESPDYVGIGPCHGTATKGYTRGLSDVELRALVEGSARLPAFAIGGITVERLPRLLGLGVRRIAVSSVVLGAQDPRATCRRLQDALSSHPD